MKFAGRKVRVVRMIRRVDGRSQLFPGDVVDCKSEWSSKDFTFLRLEKSGPWGITELLDNVDSRAVEVVE